MGIYTIPQSKFVLYDEHGNKDVGREAFSTLPERISRHSFFMSSCLWRASGLEKCIVVTIRTGSKRIVQVGMPRVDLGPTIAHDPLTTRGPLAADVLTSTKEKGNSEGQKSRFF